MMTNRATIRLPAVLGIGFTGHRQLNDEAACRQWILQFLRRHLAEMPGRLYAVSSTASGADLLFAESCLDLGIPLRILLPMPREQFRLDFDSDSWSRAENVLARAASVEVTAQSGDRHEQFYDCGTATVHQTQLLLAVWNGQSSRGQGGTAEIVNFAEKIGRPVVWMHSESGAIEVRNEQAMVRLLDDQDLAILNNLNDAGVEWPGEDPAALARAWSAKMDRNASHLAPVARRLASVPVIYTAAAALFSAFAAHGHNSGALLGASMALGVFAVALPELLRLDARQRQWARARTAAEVSRSIIAMWNAPAPYQIVGPEMIPELGGVLVSLEFLRLMDPRRKAVTIGGFRAEYAHDRLEGQIGYFSGKAASAAFEARLYRGLTWGCGALAVVAAAYLFAGRGPLPITRRWMDLSISALFQFATVTGALLVIKDCDRRRERYRELEQWLKNWAPQVDSLHSWGSLLQAVMRVERALMVELLEWRSLTRHAKLPRK